MEGPLSQGYEHLIHPDCMRCAAVVWFCPPRLLDCKARIEVVVPQPRFIYKRTRFSTRAAKTAMAPAVGFERAEMYSSPLVGTVSLYQRHVFVCYKDASSWPAAVETAELGGLPRLLFAALKARKKDIPAKIRLTVCEVGAPDSLPGDVLVFPDMLRYRGLESGDVESFVEEVMVKEKRWKHAAKLTGNYVFVCAHGSRDARCGSCGPVLIQEFKSNIARLGMEEQVIVKACSHIGGHKFAGNVIVYGGTPVTGHWYGYVTPPDVPLLLEQHIRKGQVVDRLWRGQMSLSEEEQKQSQLARRGEYVCPCGFSQGECGGKNFQAMKVEPVAASVVRLKSSVTSLKNTKNSPWSLRRQVKLTAVMALMGGATAIGLFYYFN